MKKRLTGATFDASAQTITHADFSDITLAGIQLIVNVTDQIIIYNFADTAKGGTLATDTLTLEYDTTSMDDADELMILVEDGSSTVAVSGSVTADLGANNDVTVTGTVDLGATDNAVLDTIATNTGEALTDTELRATPVPVSGTVTANLSATDNAVLDTIAAKDFATQTTLAAMNAKMVTGTDIGDVTINNSTGAAAVNIQDGGNSITVDGSLTVDLGANNDVTVTSGAITETNSGAIKTAVEVIDNAISGSEMQVDVVASLPAGTNAIGKLAANSGVDIGDVDVTSLPALAAGTNAVGKLLPPDVDVTAHSNYSRKYYTSAGAATDGIIWSPAAGKRWHVVTMYIQVSAAATVTLEDDKAGGDDPVWKGELAANSGVVLSFTEKYPMASGEDAADLTITTTAGNVYVTCVGYEV